MALQDITLEVLKYLYLEEKLTQKQIAERYGTQQDKISMLLKKWSVKPMLRSDRKDFPPVPPLQHDLLIGSLLGAGTMCVTGRQTARFIEGHPEKLSEYIRWKAHLLEPYTATIYETQKVGVSSKGLSFTTHGCKQLRPYYDLFYPYGVRVYPANMVDLMNPFVLAVWYMDDGRLNKSQPRISFAMGDQSLTRVVDALKRLKLKPIVYTNGTSHYIEFPDQESLFFDLVSPHIVPSQIHKLPVPSQKRERNKNAEKLSPERAAKLYQGGMSAIYIANIHGVGVSTVHRRLDQLGQERKPGRPSSLYDLVAAEAALQIYDPKIWSTLSETDQNVWVQEILQVLRKSPFPVVEMDNGEVRLKYKRLCNTRMFIEGDTIRPLSTVGGTVCSSFFPNRYTASYRGRPSAYVMWHDDKALQTAIRYQFKCGDPISPQRILKAVAMQGRTPTVFRPSVAKCVYEQFCPKGGTVWDPCAGYGGRLMGAMAAGVRYIGTDVEPETVSNNIRLAKAIGGVGYQVILCRAEVFEPPQVDLVFTSPPYFDIERYSNSQEQSYKRYGTYKAWLEGFLRPVIQKSFDCLKPGGHLILNVADKNGVHGVPLVKSTTDISLSIGFSFVRTLQMLLPMLNQKTRVFEPMLVFRK